MGNLIIVAIACLGVWYLITNRRQKGPTTAAVENSATPSPPDRDWQKVIADAVEQAKSHERPCVALTIADGPVTPDPHSSIGGQPSLPRDTPWPVDVNDKPMIFLAQINYAEMPPLEGYPTTGVISFFVMQDDLNGCKFPSLGADGFRVMYQSDTKDLERRALPDCDWDFVPLSTHLHTTGRPLTGQAGIGRLSHNSHTVATLTKGWYRNCPPEAWDALDGVLKREGEMPFYYGGNPDFTQQDFRHPEATPDYTDYSQVLLQLGFLSKRDAGIEVCWGDAGEACFLATPSDLAARNFDRVTFNWDCS